jgi:hypothetical protein
MNHKKTSEHNLNQDSLNIDHENLARLERVAVKFPDYIQRLEKESQKVSENIPKITLEIEELKKVKADLIPSLSEAVKKALMEERKIFVDSALKGLQDNMESILQKYKDQAQENTQKYLNDAQIFKQEMTSVVSSMTRLMNLQKQRLTRKGVLICAVFCVASVLMGGGLFYFFPQTVHYQDAESARHLVFGKVTWNNLKKLSLKDQNLLVDAVYDYLKRKG